MDSHQKWDIAQLEELSEELRNWRRSLSGASIVAYIDENAIQELIAVYGSSSHDDLFRSSAFPSKLALCMTGLDRVMHSVEALFETDSQSHIASEVGSASFCSLNRIGYALSTFFCTLLIDVLYELGDASLVISIMKVLLNFKNALNYSSNVISHTTPLADFFLREGVEVTYGDEPYVIEEVDCRGPSLSLKSLEDDSSIVVPFFSNDIKVCDLNAAYDVWKKSLRIGDVVDLKLNSNGREEWVPAVYKGREKMQDDFDYEFSYLDLCERKASFHEFSASQVCVASSRCVLSSSFTHSSFLPDAPKELACARFFSPNHDPCATNNSVSNDSDAKFTAGRIMYRNGYPCLNTCAFFTSPRPSFSTL